MTDMTMLFWRALWKNFRPLCKKARLGQLFCRSLEEKNIDDNTENAGLANQVSEGSAKTIKQCHILINKI